MVEKKPKDVTMWAFAAILSLLMGFFGVQWQQSEAAAQANKGRITELEGRHRFDIEKLTETNQEIRRRISDLESRTATLEERTRQP